MISDLHINNTLAPLSSKDSVAFALDRMILYRVDLLPLVDEQQHLVNYVNLYDIENLDKDIILADLPMYATILPFVNSNQHLFTALGHLKSLNLSLMAVLDGGLYTGILKTSDVVMALSQSMSIRSAGSIIVIRVRPLDYSFSDISRIIEYSDAKILGFFTFEIEETGEIEIHLKLNTTILKHVLATLERYDYRVVQYFNREDLTDDLDSRFENLMKFIDI